MQGVVPIPRPGIGRLLDNDLLKAKIGVTHTAVLFVRPDHQEALLPGPAEGFTVDNSSLTPGLHMWHNLCSEKFAIGIAKHVLLFGEFPLQHGATSVNVKLDGKLGGQQYGEHSAGQQ